MKKFLVCFFVITIFCSFCAVSISAAPDSPVVTANGDVNGDGYLDIKDVTLCQKYLAHMVGEEDINLDNFDFNGDGIKDVADATAIQKYITQYTPPIIVGTSAPSTPSTPSTSTSDVITFPVVTLGK